MICLCYIRGQAGHNNNQCHLDMWGGLNPPWCGRMALILSARHTLQQRTTHIVVQFIQSSILVLSALHWLFHPATKESFSTCFNIIIHAEYFFVQSTLILSAHRSRSYTQGHSDPFHSLISILSGEALYGLGLYCIDFHWFMGGPFHCRFYRRFVH